jgi:hypothetical protein
VRKKTGNIQVLDENKVKYDKDFDQPLAIFLVGTLVLFVALAFLPAISVLAGLKGSLSIIEVKFEQT